MDDRGETALDLGLLTMLAKPLSVERAAFVVQRAAGDIDDVTVLIADDDPDVRRILGETLSAAGCDVRTAASGGEMLDTARRIHPHVAVIDLLMPGMDGIEAIAAMRAEPALSGIPIVALITREMATEEMMRLTESVGAIGRGRAARSHPIAELLRSVVEQFGASSARHGAIA
jgi:CheY-like chemotaxis protein